MKERPIIFPANMIGAILDGRKTQTRRVITSTQGCKELGVFICRKDEPEQTVIPFMPIQKFIDEAIRKGIWMPSRMNRFCPFGQPGDRLWVRESWRTEELEDDGLDGVRFRADNGFQPIADTVAASDAWIEANYRGLGKWRSPVLMPRWASRIDLEITNVRVEQLQDITFMEAVAEGFDNSFPWNNFGTGSIPKDAFAEAWNEYYERRGYPWKNNPWVWAITFKRSKP